MTPDCLSLDFAPTAALSYYHTHPPFDVCEIYSPVLLQRRLLTQQCFEQAAQACLLYAGVNFKVRSQNLMVRPIKLYI